MTRISNVTNKAIKKKVVNKNTSKITNKNSQNGSVASIQPHRETKPIIQIHYIKGLRLDTVTLYKGGNVNDIEYANECIGVYNVKSNKLILYNPEFHTSLNYERLVNIGRKMWSN